MRKVQKQVLYSIYMMLYVMIQFAISIHISEFTQTMTNGYCMLHYYNTHIYTYKISHFSAQRLLHSKTASASEIRMDSAHLSTLSGELKSVWSATLKPEGTDVQFKIDTGAEEVTGTCPSAVAQ